MASNLVDQDIGKEEDLFSDKTKRKKLLPNSTPTLKASGSKSSLNSNNLNSDNKDDLVIPDKDDLKKGKRTSWSISEKYHLFWTIKKYGNIHPTKRGFRIDWKSVEKHYRENGGVGNAKELRAMWNNLKIKASRIHKNECFGTHLDRKIARFYFGRKSNNQNGRQPIKCNKVADESRENFKKGTSSQNDILPDKIGKENIKLTTCLQFPKAECLDKIEAVKIEKVDQLEEIDKPLANIQNSQTKGRKNNLKKKNINSNIFYNKSKKNQRRRVNSSKIKSISPSDREICHRYKETDLILNNAKTYADASTNTIDSQYMNQINRTIDNNEFSNVVMNSITIENRNHDSKNRILKEENKQVTENNESQDDDDTSDDDEYYSLLDIEEKLGIKLLTPENMTLSDSEMDQYSVVP